MDYHQPKPAWWLTGGQLETRTWQNQTQDHNPQVAVWCCAWVKVSWSCWNGKDSQDSTGRDFLDIPSCATSPCAQIQDDSAPPAPKQLIGWRSETFFWLVVFLLSQRRSPSERREWQLSDTQLSREKFGDARTRTREGSSASASSWRPLSRKQQVCDKLNSNRWTCVASVWPNCKERRCAKSARTSGDDAARAASPRWERSACSAWHSSCGRGARAAEPAPTWSLTAVSARLTGPRIRAGSASESECCATMWTWWTRCPSARCPTLRSLCEYDHLPSMLWGGEGLTGPWDSHINNNNHNNHNF